MKYDLYQCFIINTSISVRIKCVQNVFIFKKKKKMTNPYNQNVGISVIHL